MWNTTSRKIGLSEMNRKMKTFKKDMSVSINNFAAAHELLDYDSRCKYSFKELLDLYYIDYDMVPLLVQDNYLAGFDATFSRNNINDLHKMSLASDFIAYGDTISTHVRNK